MSIGLIVLMGAFFLLDRAASVSQELTNRQDAKIWYQVRTVWHN